MCRLVERREKLQERPPEINYSSCKRYGPSYRALPKAYQYMKCTGRDELCNEVLNDVWVSFPTWSEDSVFLSSKKNVYEEALYKCEDERYEMDRIIEANMATINVLEAASQKMSTLSGEELVRFKLNNSLNGTSECIYAAALRRIYGDRAVELLESLKRNPTVTVPVVLQRLKQKDDEWHRIKVRYLVDRSSCVFSNDLIHLMCFFCFSCFQREWIKIWAEIHEKNYYKALDHQGLNFKTNDKKSLTMKSLVSEIEAILNEQQAKRADTFGQPDITENPVHLEYFFRKSAIFEDCARVLRLFLLKGGSFSNNEKERIESFFHSIVLTAFEVGLKDETRFSKISGLYGLLTPANRATDKLETQAFLKSAAIEPTEDKQTVESEANQRITTDTIRPDLNALRSAVVSDDNGTAPLQNSKNPSGFVAFVNSPLYVLLRAIQSFYGRLMKIQSVAERISRRPEKYRRTSSLALKLGIQKDFLPHITETQYYNELFSILDKFFDGELDQALFEDQIRYMFGTSAYVLFTIDKFCLNLCRLMLNIISDEKSLQLFELWQRYKSDQKTTDGRHEALLDRYYDMCDRIVGPEYLYRISYEPKERRLSIQLLDRGATSPESLRSLKERWVDYVDEYVKLELTGKDLLPKRPVFLSRNIPKTMDAASIMEQTTIKNNLECKICVNTYRMFFVENTYDLLYRFHPSFDEGIQRERQLSIRRHEKFHQWWSTTRRDETLFGDVAEADARCDRWFEKGEGLLNLRRFSTRVDYVEDPVRSKIDGLDHRYRVYKTELEDLGEIGTEPDTDQLNASDIAMDENEAPAREGEDEDSVMEDENMSSMISDEEQ